MSQDPKIPFVPLAIPHITLQVLFDSVKACAQLALIARGHEERIQTTFDSKTATAGFKTIAEGCAAVMKAIQDIEAEVHAIRFPTETK